MRIGSRVVVVVPAWEEALRIARVVRGIPSWVDAIVVVDDASTDGTADAAASVLDARVEVVRHAHNRGVGAAIVSGYRRAAEIARADRDAYVVMAGDGQMDPADLVSVVDPVARGEADYVKGDRFASGTIGAMPLSRRVGGLAFSWATSRAIGVSISDSQCGYTAIARDALVRLDLDEIWPRYGYPNDLLSQVALRGMRIAQVPVRAVYADEVSRLAPRHVPMVAALVARAWFRRLASRR
ncbi:MAG TPA: glycosyltransferase family 2 protein [Polyangiaceae bacterium]|jgi:glycosyltransferase involved in cell wall biosynthesis